MLRCCKAGTGLAAKAREGLHSRAQGGIAIRWCTRGITARLLKRMWRDGPGQEVGRARWERNRFAVEVEELYTGGRSGPSGSGAGDASCALSYFLTAVAAI